MTVTKVAAVSNGSHGTKPARRKLRLTAAEKASIDADVVKSKGAPGYEMVRLFGELAKLGPYDFKKFGR